MYPVCGINLRGERMTMRGGWSPFSGLHCKIVNSLSQGNFTLVGENSRDFKNLRLRQSFKGFEIFLIGLKDFPCLFLPVLKKSWNVHNPTFCSPVQQYIATMSFWAKPYSPSRPLFDYASIELKIVLYASPHFKCFVRRLYHDASNETARKSH